MQGAGNDFVVIDATRDAFTLSSEQIRHLADRQFGVGADQVLVVERATLPGVDFRYRIFNADGGEVEHCGNGARCFVKFVRDTGLTDALSIRVQVANGTATLTVCDNGEVSVEMGAPILEPARVPFDAHGLTPLSEGAATLWKLDVAGYTVPISVVSMGNPHAVQFVDDVDRHPVETEGPLVEAHPRFPRRVNAGFAEIVDRHTLRLRVYERGAGETLACGTGACAAVVAAILRDRADSPVQVRTRGGNLTISWNGRAQADAPVMMAGPAEKVFEGQIELTVLSAPLPFLPKSGGQGPGAPSTVALQADTTGLP